MSVDRRNVDIGGVNFGANFGGSLDVSGVKFGVFSRPLWFGANLRDVGGSAFGAKFGV
jgi:hypothetical protein